MNVNVVDSPCGTGKTEWAIKYMNDNCGNSRFLYVTPYLNEIQRIKDSTVFDMYEPKTESKSRDLKKLIISGKHIATTHALFSKGDGELMQALTDNGYELILDEVMTVLEPLRFKKGDYNIFVKDKIFNVLEDNSVILTKEGLDLLNDGSDFEDKLLLIQSGRVIMADAGMMLWEFPVDLLKCFSKITIMTYMFKQQTMCNFLLANGAELSFYYMDNYILTGGLCSYDGRKYKELINIYDGKLNSIGAKDYSLSSSWFENNNNSVSRKILSNNAYNYLRNIVNKRSSEVMWTVPKNSVEKAYVKVSNYSLSFLEMTARATNLYADRDTCAYLVNRYENPAIHNYFVKHGLSVNNDIYALSELIQWLFRSAIRKNKPINLYIPSKRMRELLQSWLDGSFDEKYNNGGKQ